MAIDTTRASRDGHHYHEAWVMRKSLGLITRANKLTAIAIEGLSIEDGKGAHSAITEIADATFYYGNDKTIRSATAVEVAQFKYAVDETKPFRAADAKKTIEKFALSDTEFIKAHGAAEIRKKVKYLLITNRPIIKSLRTAIEFASRGEKPSDDEAKTQYEQLRLYSGLDLKDFKAFCSRFSLVGETGAIGQIETEGRSHITNLSASSDIIVKGRFGELAALIRKKAGVAGQKDNVIEIVDVLGALGINNERDLLPTPDVFVDPGSILDRLQLDEFEKLVGQKGQWIILAGGGVGKTVFVQSLAAKYQKQDEVVTFDCFGGGAYRSIADGRHLPQRGLMHLVNELACRGLCDPILPGSDDPAEVIRASLRRFEQIANLLQSQKPARRLVVIIDAADNAGWEADRRGEVSFPRELLTALAQRGGIKGLVVILTTRPERKETAIGDAACAPFCLNSFTLPETTKFINARRPEVTTAQIAAIQARSDGNARVVANLIDREGSLDQKDRSKVDLDTLLKARIDKAIKQTQEKGVDAEAIKTFLCALANLPPPVPISDLASAFGIQEAEVESFVADLSPLLDRTSLGIIFRDEPTESLVQSLYGNQVSLLTQVVVRLTAEQAQSIYAARALPILLHAMRDVEALRKLAFDMRFPPQLRSEVAKRAIRKNRLVTALSAAASEDNFNALVELSVELSVVESTDQRGVAFLQKNPELVAGLSDPEALRRLFEAKTGWPGRRSNALAISYVADGNTAEAYEHARRGHDWLYWYYDQEDELKRRFNPDLDDYASTPLYLVASGKYENAIRFLNNWSPQYAYKIACRVLEILHVSHSLGKNPTFSNQIKSIISASAVSVPLLCSIPRIYKLQKSDAIVLTRRISASIKGKKPLVPNQLSSSRDDRYKLALLRCGMLAGSLGLLHEARQIKNYAHVERFGIWALGEVHYVESVIPVVLDTIVECLVKKREPNLFDCLPRELWGMVSGVRTKADSSGRKEIVLKKLKALPTEADAERVGQKAPLSNNEKRRAEETLTSHVLPLLHLVRLWWQIAKKDQESGRRKAFTAMFKEWEQYFVSKKDDFSPRDVKQYFDRLYSAAAIHGVAAFTLTGAHYSSAIQKWATVSKFLPTALVIEYIHQFSMDSESQIDAGKLAGLALKGIEANDDTTVRAEEYTDLAKGIIAANVAEAAQLFTRALSELDAIGSGDHELTNEVLNFAARMSGGQISDEAAFQLAKICELNNYDSDKFPWPLAGKAFAQAWGSSYLAQLMRWEDRKKTSLELALPPTLMSLMERGKLEPTDAVGLLSLVDGVEAWGWDWANIVESILKVDPTNKLTLLKAVFKLMKRVTVYTPWEESLLKIENLIRDIDQGLLNEVAELKNKRRASDDNRERIDRAKNEYHRANPIRQTKKTKQATDLRIQKTNPLSKDSLEQMIEAINARKDIREDRAQIFAKLRRRVKVGDRVSHMRSVVEMRNIPASVKTTLIQSMSSDWSDSSPTWREQLRGMGAQMVRQHADDLMLRDWGFGHELAEISRATGDEVWLLAKELISATTSRRLIAGKSGWLYLASLLAQKADQQVPGKALERLLESGIARFADKIGDGVWSKRYSISGESAEVAAGTIWHCLGHPDAVERWRAAHTVRLFAELNRWEVIDNLFGLLKKTAQVGYSANGVKFFELYAKQWFLLAVERISIDYPERVLANKEALSSIVFDRNFANVGLQVPAKKALINALEKNQNQDATELLRNVQIELTSPFPRVEGTGFISRNYWDRPKGVKEKIEFNFEYDFGQYEIPKVGGLFGVPGWEVADQIAEWANKIDASVSTMYDDGGREGGRRDYRGEDDKVESYGTYIGKQALSLTVGSYLRQKPIVGREYDVDPLSDWMSRFGVTRTDGLWLADGTGPYPEFVTSQLLKHEKNKDPSPTKKPAEILSAAGIRMGHQLSTIRVYGSWKSSEAVSVSVSSVLVAPDQAKRAGIALVTGEENQVWLPVLRNYEEDDARRYGESDMVPFEPWITISDVEQKIDEHDPYGVKAATTRPRLSREIIQAFNLNSMDAWNEEWKSGATPGFRARAWGSMRGIGRHAEWNEGTTVECGRAFLRKVLRKRNRCLILLVTLQNYIEHPIYEKKREYGGIFKYAHAAAIIDSKMRVQILKPSQSQIDAVSRLSRHDRFDFSSRLNAI